MRVHSTPIPALYAEFEPATSDLLVVFQTSPEIELDRIDVIQQGDRTYVAVRVLVPVMASGRPATVSAALDTRSVRVRGAAISDSARLFDGHTGLRLEAKRLASQLQLDEETALATVRDRVQ